MLLLGKFIELLLLTRFFYSPIHSGLCCESEQGSRIFTHPMAPRCALSTPDASICRASLLRGIFNATEPPSRAPDEFIRRTSWPSFPRGKNASWSASSSDFPHKLVWTIATPFLALNSTVLHYQSSGHRRRADTIVIFHHGHESGQQCKPHDNGESLGLSGHLLRAGHDAMELFMPLKGCNRWVCMKGCNRWSRAVSLLRGRHDWFKRFERQYTSGQPLLRFFLEPLMLAANHARRLGYSNVVLVGLSGGGWTSLAVSSMLPSVVRLTVVIAGLCRDPLFKEDFARREDDFEKAALWKLADERQLYLLSAHEAGRGVLQIYHEHDQCCCTARTLGWERVRSLDAAVRSRVRGSMRTIILNERRHAVNPSDRAVVLRAVEMLRRSASGLVGPIALANLHSCDMLSNAPRGCVSDTPNSSVQPNGEITVLTKPKILPIAMEWLRVETPANGSKRYVLAAATYQRLVDAVKP